MRNVPLAHPNIPDKFVKEEITMYHYTFDTLLPRSGDKDDPLDDDRERESIFILFCVVNYARLELFTVSR